MIRRQHKHFDCYLAWKRDKRARWPNAIMQTMERKTVMILLAFVLIVAGSMVYLSTNDSARQAAQNMRGTSLSETNTQRERAPADKQPTPGSSSGSYLDYDESNFAAAEGTKIIYFHASWCPQCRALESDIKSQGVPSGVTILKTDYDTSQTLRKKYGVTLQTTLVLVDDQGNLVKKHVAYHEPTLDAVIKNLL